MEEKIYSPVDGQAVKLEYVPDEMFAKKMLGDGLAVQPIANEWVSPVNGTITMIYETKHAIGITTDQGCELLLHIGLDTCELHGTPFQMKVNQNDHVNVGTPLISVDLDYIKQHGYEVIAPIISTNKKVTLIKTDGEVKAGDVLFQIND